MGLLKSGEVRNVFEFQYLPEIRPLGDHLGRLPVVGLEELSKGQHREVLGLDKVLAAELGGVWRESLLADGEGSSREIQCGLGHGGHGLSPLSMTSRSAFS